MKQEPSRERHERVRAIFVEAARLPPSAREAFFAARRDAGEASVTEEARALLLHHAEAPDFLATPALAPSDGVEALPPRIGSYRILAKLGEGGMGTVFDAVHERTEQRVAVKVLHSPLNGESARRRFEREARLLARLHHRGIAQIFDTGEFETAFGSQRFIVMERVEGLPITEFADRARLGSAARLSLFAAVCDAVQHAHDRGVVHRDLKPANVLVERDGRPKLIDFGIARLALGDDLGPASLLTASRSILGTVPYLSPEQASGEGREIDGRSDVYSLGVLLYELMTGDIPFAVRSKSMAESLRMVIEKDPTPPAARVRALRGDVENIIRKAMEKEPGRRYATAAALASDLRRHLRHEPIDARQPSASYVMLKFARRNRAVVAGTLATFAALAGGGAIALKLAVDEHAARELAEKNAYRSSIVSAAAALGAGDSAGAGSYLSRAPERLREWEWRYLDRQIEQSLASFGSAGIDPITDVAFSADGARIFSATKGGGVRAWNVGKGAPVEGSGLVPGGDGSATFALGPNGESCLSADPTGERLTLRRTESGEVLSEIRRPTQAIVNAEISFASRRVAVRRADSGVELFDTTGDAARTIVVFRSHGTWRNEVAFSPDGSLLAFGQTDGLVRVLDATSGAERARFQEKEPTCSVAFSPDGSRLAVGYGVPYPSPGGGCVILDLAEPGREVRIPIHSTYAGRLDFSPDGARIAVGTATGLVLVFDAATGNALASYRTRESFMHKVAFSPDGRFIVAGSLHGTTKILLAEPAPEEAEILRDHANFVYACAFSPDGSTIASGGWDNAVRLWDAASATPTAVLRGHEGFVKTVEFDPSGRSLLSVAADRTYRLWDPRTGRQTARFSEAGGDIIDGKFTPDGKLLVVATDHPKRMLATRDIVSGESVAVALEVGDFVDAIAVSPDGRFLATGWRDGHVRFYDLPSLVLRRQFAGRRRSVNSVSYSSDGTRLAIGDIDGTVQVIDASTFEVAFVALAHGGEMFAETFAASFSPDSSRLAMGGRDGILRLVDSTDGEIVAKLPGHFDYIYRLAWSPDGGRIVTASGDKTLRIWDTTSVRERLGARLAEERARAAAAPRIRSLYAELGDADAVVARIESDPALSEDERAALLREALRQRP